MAYIKISKTNFFYNLQQFATKIGSKDKIAIVIKDNGYGHGLEIIAKLSKEFGLTKGVVRYYSEAKRVKGYLNDILILGDKAVVDKSCSFALNSLEDIHNAEKGATVELKIDTGMHRNGIAIEDLERALSLIERRGLILKGIMTHNRSADELSSELFWQHKRFEDIKKRVKIANIRFHSFNSATTLRLNPSKEDMVRIGIGAYGYNELPSIYNSLKLKPILSLWAKRVATRKLNKGERIGYGGRFVAPKDMKVSTYDLGYGDGWFRNDEKKPFIIDEGLPILGRVSMDYIVLESTKDEVCIMNDAQKVGREAKTISYEILTRLSPDLERIVYN